MAIDQLFNPINPEAFKKQAAFAKIRRAPSTFRNHFKAGLSEVTALSHSLNPGDGAGVEPAPRLLNPVPPDKEWTMNALSHWEPCSQLKDLLELLGRVFGVIPARTTNGDKKSMPIPLGNDGCGTRST